MRCMRPSAFAALPDCCLRFHTAMLVPLLLLAAALSVTLPGAPAAAQIARQDAAQADAERQRQIASHWANFNHYVLIRRPDMARAAGESLLEMVDEEDDDLLVTVIEQGDYPDYDQNFQTARNIEELRNVAEALERRVQSARIALARDEQRIAEDIDRLAAGQRPFRNAVERLRGAGQFAAPQMLETLADSNRQNLHPFVRTALERIGQPVVYPLAIALPRLDPVTQGQVAQVLAEIGYSFPLPYLKEVLEREDVDPSAREKLERAYDRLLAVSEHSRGLSAAELFETLARNQYTAATHQQRLPGFDRAQEVGIVWEYHPEIGLVPITVPPQIHGDVLAMRSARRALTLEPNMDAALSRWLMANLRRTNRLDEDEQDPSYPDQMEPPSFYAMIAGPSRLHDVLAQALNDGDERLALDAILALSHTAGTDALVAREAGRQPLLTALSYPDRRVRFDAALTLAQARPTEGFPEAHRVVPVLAEALRHDEARYALVLAADRDTLNRRLADVAELGYETFGGRTLAEARSALRRRPGVDVIVIDMGVDGAVQAFRDTAGDHRLGGVPVVMIGEVADQYRIREELGRDARLFMTTPPVDPEQEEPAEDDAAALAEAEAGDEPEDQAASPLASAIEQATEAYAGRRIDADEARDYALRALRSLHQIALAKESAYDAEEALPALTHALEDERTEVVREAAGVLAVIDRSEAQRALAQHALEREDDTLQIVVLERLGDSATAFGNMLETRHSDALLELVRASTGETALAAARAHGALALPTANAVELILGPDRE